MTGPIPADLLATLDIAVLELIDGDRFGVVGTPPSWLTTVWPDVVGAEGFTPHTRSPFLEHFLVDARRCWESRGETSQRSGVWIELDHGGTEWFLEATACRVGARRLLTIENTRTTYQENANLLQRARENALHFQQLVREVEKKDVLLHCIVHDLRSPLVSVKSLLTLLRDEHLGSKTRELVEAGRTQLERQDLLIRTILDVFRADVDSVRGTPHDVYDIVQSARAAVETFAPLCELRSVALSLEIDRETAGGLEVVGERLRLFRVFANLVENALRHSTANASVTIRIRKENGAAFVAVDDEGPGVEPALAERLFDRFSQSGERRGNVGLGLHFCRITVEGWGGEIGQQNRAEGGARFWFRLPVPPGRERTGGGRS